MTNNGLTVGLVIILTLVVTNIIEDYKLAHDLARYNAAVEVNNESNDEVLAALSRRNKAAVADLAFYEKMTRAVTDGIPPIWVEAESSISAVHEITSCKKTICARQSQLLSWAP